MRWAAVLLTFIAVPLQADEVIRCKATIRFGSDIPVQVDMVLPDRTDSALAFVDERSKPVLAYFGDIGHGKVFFKLGPSSEADEYPLIITLQQNGGVVGAFLRHRHITTFRIFPELDGEKNVFVFYDTWLTWEKPLRGHCER